MRKIWYLLKCPEGNEEDYMEKCRKLDRENGLTEIVCFRYQRLMRYGGGWHMERRMLLPGFIFLYGKEEGALKNTGRREKFFLYPCESPYVKVLCSHDNLIHMSRGIIRNGTTVVTEGPLKGRENLIRKIDRHKRTAKLGVPFGGKTVEITVGLEIYQKET